jgi:hypothetical protein
MMGSHARRVLALGLLLLMHRDSAHVSGFALHPISIAAFLASGRVRLLPLPQRPGFFDSKGALLCKDGGGEETNREERLRKLGFSSGGKKDADLADSRARRAFLATTLSPLASVSLVYLVVPSVLSEKTRQADWYKSNFASKMGGMDDYEVHIKGLKEDLFSLIRPDDVVLELVMHLALPRDRVCNVLARQSRY